jgi:pyruvate dehydrogenase E2 component (dihydrolipoamide acetyltransferase)
VPTELIMPSLGFDMTEGKVARWLKQEGDRIEKGQVIAEIETEKATVEIEATVSGILRKIAVQAGETVAVGTVIGIIAGEDERPAEAQKARAPSPPPAPSAGEGRQRPGERRQEAEDERQKAEERREGAGKRREEPEEAEEGPPERRIKASPVARKMAEEAGIDLARITGSGPGGRIMERDVQAAVEAGPSREEPAPAEPPEGEVVPLNRMRRAIARRMAESKANAPHFYVTVEVNMDEALKIRNQLNELAPDAEKISLNDLIVAAAARALKRFPNLNASYRDGSLAKRSRINIGIAVALENGLIPPVLRDADRKTLKEIAAESKALGERARAGRLRSDDLGSGTFTISNLGMFGVDEFIAIINPPEAAILAVGAVTQRPVAADGEVRIAAVMKATLSVDHRVSDGAEAGRFMQALRKLLENPVHLVAG